MGGDHGDHGDHDCFVGETQLSFAKHRPIGHRPALIAQFGVLLPFTNKSLSDNRSAIKCAMRQ
jgi:hypothetical protein